ncbi:MAG: DMT family transporter [bacterium]
MKDSKTLTYFLLALSTAFWGVSFVMTKELLDVPHMTVPILITLRMAVATAVMLPVLALAHKLERIRKEDIKWFLLLALCEPFIYNLCETNGVNNVSSSLASVVVATIPLFVPFGMWLGYRKRIKIAMLIGVVMSLIGVGIMLIGGEALTGSVKGLLFLAVAVFIAVVYTLILVKIVNHYRPVTITVYQNLIGLVYFLPLSFLSASADDFQFSFFNFQFQDWLYILLLGICCSTLAYVFYNRGVRHLGAAEACIFNNAIPVVTFLVALSLPGLAHPETFSWLKLLGIVTVISGVIIAQQQPWVGK